jgi:hypothetical protein
LTNANLVMQLEDSTVTRNGVLVPLDVVNELLARYGAGHHVLTTL